MRDLRKAYGVWLRVIAQVKSEGVRDAMSQQG